MLAENDARRILSREGVDFGPGSAAGVDFAVGSSGPANFLVELTWNGRTRRFAAEYRRGSTPKEIEGALAQVRRKVRGGSGLLPMVVAPYLSDEMVSRLLEEQVSGIDLSGNSGIIVPGEWLIVNTGKPNRYPSSAPIKAIYRGTSSLVGRVMLSRTRYARVTDVQAEIAARGGKVSLGTVSKVLKALDADLILTRKPEIRLVQPERLLDRLRDRYAPPDVRERRAGRLDLSPATLRTLESNARANGARVAGRSESRYVVGADTGPLTIYTTDVDAVLENVPFEPGARFANVELVETDDPRVYFDARQEEGFSWVAPLQVYLELAAGGKREQQLAQQIRADLVPNPEPS